MQEITCFSLQQHGGPYESWPQKSQLLRDGQPCGLSLPGYLLEAQYQVEDCFLLVSSYDCPFEEANHFSLLNRKLEILDRLFLGAPYATFLILGHRPVSDHEILFDFGDHERILSIGPYRQLWRTRYLKLRRKDSSLPGAFPLRAD